MPPVEMHSLLDLYRQLEPSKWDYYDGVKDRKPIPNVWGNDIANPYHHRGFIESYFRSAGKWYLLEDFHHRCILEDDRAVHTNSVFFLGMLLRENTILKTHLFYEKRSKMNYPIFPFVWFLSILFHDFGMVMEKQLKAYPELVIYEGLLNEFGITHPILEQQVANIDTHLFNHVIRYYNYRIACGSIDHGILAATFLYDRLVKIRLLKRAEQDDELSWHSTLDKKYALAAASVACHNMWTKADDHKDAPMYKEYGLDYMLQSNFVPISIKSFPLLFLFGIVDTIDPIKHYMREKHSPEVILSNLEIGFKKRSFTIRNKQDSPLNFSILVDKVNGLKGWMAVDIIERDDAQSITVKFL